MTFVLACTQISFRDPSSNSYLCDDFEAYKWKLSLGYAEKTRIDHFSSWQ